MEENNVSPDTRSTDELDAIADQADSPRNSPERPMSKEPEKGSQGSKEEYEFVHNGKPVKGTRDQIIKWAQMGYDRPQFAQKLNQEKLKWEQEKSQFEQVKQKYTPYQQIDEWASKNPTQWQQLEALWKQGVANPHGFSQQPSQSAQIPQDLQPYLSKIQSLETQLQQLAPTVQQMVEKEQLFQQKEEDSKLHQEIQSIRESHKDLDWNTIDGNGKSLETRVLEHAQANGISKFGPAFRDLLHDELISRAQAQAKLGVARGIQTRTKLGVLGESPTSQKGMASNIRDIRNTTYNDIEGEIREELARGVYR